MPDRVFGEIPGYPEDYIFASRQELSAAGVHRPLQAGISGSAKEGADSIVLSGGSEDDVDHGDVIVYTGHGGRDPVTSQQVTDQLLTFGNLALAYSCVHGLPVRVVRGANHRSPYSPPVGYCYCGLFRVEDYWRERGRSGHTVWRFRLVKIASQDQAIVVPKLITETPGEYITAPRQTLSVLCIVRDTEQARKLKVLYDYCCQVCQVRLEGSAGPYAEAAHIRPLGTPHDGPDTPDNLLCLCPNHHVLFDYGGFAISDDWSLLGNRWAPATAQSTCDQHRSHSLPPHPLLQEHLAHDAHSPHHQVTRRLYELTPRAFAFFAGDLLSTATRQFIRNLKSARLTLID